MSHRLFLVTHLALAWLKHPCSETPSVHPQVPLVSITTLHAGSFQEPVLHSCLAQVLPAPPVLGRARFALCCSNTSGVWLPDTECFIVAKSCGGLHSCSHRSVPTGDHLNKSERGQPALLSVLG